MGGLPEVPGILVAMRLAPGLQTHLRGLADELLVKDFPGATLTRAEREILATAVSAQNDCFYCMDSHGAFAGELLARAGHREGETLIDAVKRGQDDALDERMKALVALARAVARGGRTAKAADVDRAKRAGASDGDAQLAVLIAAAFCMYNRMVDGLRARTPPDAEAYRARAREIADHGYSDARVKTVPR
ncbi:MAG TPA: carboxymuconolactone decarboxylase family protein [Polyangiaceae bacterium]